jgi:hypothetical protein
MSPQAVHRQYVTWLVRRVSCTFGEPQVGHVAQPFSAIRPPEGKPPARVGRSGCSSASRCPGTVYGCQVLQGQRLAST